MIVRCFYLSTKCLPYFTHLHFSLFYMLLYFINKLFKRSHGGVIAVLMTERNNAKVKQCRRFSGLHHLTIASGQS